jgi:hypothetical protein
LIRRRQTNRPTMAVTGDLDGLHEWVRSLPWVVERPRDPDAPHARTFAVDCGLLGVRRVWLVTGIHDETVRRGAGLAVVLPEEAVSAVAADGEGRGVAFLTGGHALVTLSTDRRQPLEVERLLLSAYCHAMSAPNATDGA